MVFNTVKIGEKILAIVVKSGEGKDKLNFVTPNNFPLQVGIHNKQKNSNITAHEHIAFKELHDLPVQEIFYVERGKIRVGLYDKKKKFQDIILSKGDLIILNSGHDVAFLEDSRIIEVKQGPYRGREYEKKDI